MSEQPPGADRPDSAPEPTRTGLETAREMLAAARAQARRTRGARPAVSSTGRGAAARRSGAAPDDRDPQALDSTIGRLLAERGWETEAAVAGVLARWSLVVGADLAAHSRPESYDDGELVVATDSTAWATQLRLLAPQLLSRLAEELGPNVVRRVRVLGPAAPSWRKGPRSVRGRGPRDTYG